jgi:hypothetical protein
MARQKTKSSDKFGSGGSKDNSPEEKFFIGDPDIQIDAEWKAMDMLRTSLDDLTDVVNANDAASGSYADLKKDYITSSGSFSSRVTTNDAKTGISTKQIDAIAANTAKTGISAGQAKAITENTKKVSATVTSNVLAGITLVVTKKGELIITAGAGDEARKYTIAPDE